jgi:hypothetical protein
MICLSALILAEAEFFRRAEMLDTKVGTAEKDDPADVAKNGFKAMMSGRGGQRMVEQAPGRGCACDPGGKASKEAFRNGCDGGGKPPDRASRDLRPSVLHYFCHPSVRICESLRGDRGVRLSLLNVRRRPPQREGAVQPPDSPHAPSTPIAPPLPNGLALSLGWRRMKR